jgi:hypothetical protein
MSKAPWTKPKLCRRCKNEFPRTPKFFSGKGLKGGYCRKCADAALEASQLNNPKKPKHESGHWLSEKMKRLRVRAARQNVPFDLDIEFMREKYSLTHCEFTGIEFAASGPFAKSIDRRDPSSGYVKANVQMVVWIHNAARGNWGDEALARYVAALVTRRRK